MALTVCSGVRASETNISASAPEEAVAASPSVREGASGTVSLAAEWPVRGGGGGLPAVHTVC